jgi:hypothetical protein
MSYRILCIKFHNLLYLIYQSGGGRRFAAAIVTRRVVERDKYHARLVTEAAMNTAARQGDYIDCWSGLKKRFDPRSARAPA